ncbi:CRISPR-associated protein, Csh2 family [Halanaerobium congolense]|jgi:CRISPR-associated protein Csh2|uniref:CRISPR-associated Csh2 family protein n=1 Tax=Halanaerobium congolense TaxID=54121 RepID=A0A1G8M3D8_9FIRM|nr:type I-B CRISPR-associated protein Cas7/Csh2 [Halanaerobium congolense]PUU90624.1 MAG: Csh2 family CRISPR-associated protein [Halanaerobium sp.]TDS28940.1 CRISPR-associated Csh2 family protein [Halanaerobium congolense]SDI62462.1 CRISPR-associated protein, Csh2 family [Halanaerobium congolense]SET33693.1 CRISPR-associated protein, Csh2 family [Halanaerobium congolense]
MAVIDQRSELVFLYDIKDANPNGDPLDANKPRIDEETGINLVTDVRLKRTIRDYLFDYKGFNGEDGKDIFVREIKNDDKSIQDGKERAKDFKEDPKKVLEQCIDVRMFGGVIPLTGDSITYTGPVQFQMGRSLHKVELNYIKGTGAFASGAGKSKKTFREEYVVPYSLVGFYGIINENAAQSTELTKDDVELLLEGIWKGTKNLITRSKVGQTPRLLLKVNYSEENYFIGELKNYIKLETGLREEEIRDVSDYNLDISELLAVIEDNFDKIESVEYKVNPRVEFVSDSKKINLSNLDLFEELDI